MAVLGWTGPGHTAVDNTFRTKKDLVSKQTLEAEASATAGVGWLQGVSVGVGYC